MLSTECIIFGKQTDSEFRWASRDGGSFKKRFVVFHKLASGNIKHSVIDRNSSPSRNDDVKTVRSKTVEIRRNENK